MTDISKIPTEEMLADRTAAIEDIGICTRALSLGVTHHRDGFPVRDRIYGNEQQIKVIDEELARRGVTIP